MGSVIEKFEFSPKMAIVSNQTVYNLYGSVLYESMRANGFDPVEILLPDGEQHKNLSSVEKIYGSLLKAKLDRKSAIVALGGGVIGDMAGFAASTYMRGIDFVQVPTTLLAQVDSSVGGKTGVNHPLGKNMIGTFWQPRLVWIDTRSLSTLPTREFLSGLAEVIKYGVIWDRELFEFLETNRDAVMNLDQQALMFIIGRSCEIKAEIVSRDEREGDLRSILNFGHTVGHAIETATGYGRYLHGEAVAVGMNLEARIASLTELCREEDARRIQKLIASFGLPSELPGGITFDDLIRNMQLDKKTVSGRVRFILPREIGTVEMLSDIPEETVIKSFDSKVL
jgi:3-dehydroquinate synthase